MPQARPELRVEGPDDLHALMHLLICNGVDCDPKQSPQSYPEIKCAGGVSQLLEGMTLAIQISTGRAVGFVIDADISPNDRWAAVRARLIAADVQVPETMPIDGFVGHSARYDARIGVWLMPDNQASGTLEDFLSALVDDGDRVIGHAELATDKAKHLGASFTSNDRLKAVLHTWLAWQEEPGLPYGTAVKALYFRHDHQLVLKFVRWFKRLYDIPEEKN